jgi:hypothetical protein
MLFEIATGFVADAATGLVTDSTASLVANAASGFVTDATTSLIANATASFVAEPTVLGIFIVFRVLAHGDPFNCE